MREQAFRGNTGPGILLVQNISGSREVEFGRRNDVRLPGMMVMRAADLTGFGASPKRLIDDGLNGPRAASAFSAAAEAAIDLLGAAGQLTSRRHRIADVLIADDVAGTNYH
jgi:hypothetical protein